MNTAERHDTRYAPAGANDHLATDLLAKDPVRGADVVAAFRGDRRRLQAEAVLADCLRSLEDDLVVRRAPRCQREVEARELELQPGQVGCEHPQRFVQQLLARLVPLEHHDRLGIHGCGH